MAYNPVTDTPFVESDFPADTLLVSNVPATFRSMMTRLNEVASAIYSQTRNIGVISIWHGPTAPTNFLPCEGVEIDPSYTILRNIYGDRTPDYRGWFLRGWAHGFNGGGADPDFSRAVTSGQSWAVGAHSHQFTAVQNGIGDNHIGNGPNVIAPDTRETGNNPTGESRPSNIAVLYIVRAQ